ncbi:ArsR/SmtB family transcription factor [Enterococcus sp. LJL98]
MDYQKNAKTLKGIAEPNRLKIIHLLSGGTMCACDLLEHFEFTQPTLSHHMKILEKEQLVSVEKKGQWHYYTLEESVLVDFIEIMHQFVSTQKRTSVACDSLPALDN